MNVLHKKHRYCLYCVKDDGCVTRSAVMEQLQM